MIESAVKTCDRCGSKLEEGMSIVRIGVFLGQDSYNLCRSCTNYLIKWLRRRVEKPA